MQTIAESNMQKIYNECIEHKLREYGDEHGAHGGGLQIIMDSLSYPSPSTGNRFPLNCRLRLCVIRKALLPQTAKQTMTRNSATITILTLKQVQRTIFGAINAFRLLPLQVNRRRNSGGKTHSETKRSRYNHEDDVVLMVNNGRGATLKTDARPLQAV